MEFAQTDHFKLLCDFGELNWIFSDSSDIDSFLHKIVTMVARHTEADACTIFLYDEEKEVLVLRAMEGLRHKTVGKISLKLGEGLTGLSLKELKPICVEEAPKHPNFKYIKEIDEEQFESFLSVPILRGIAKIGVITLHRGAKRYFNDQDIQALQAIASQLANIIENARLFMEVSPKTDHLKRQRAVALEGKRQINGMTASEGFAWGKAFVLDRERSMAILQDARFKSSYTLEDFWRAIGETEKQLRDLQLAVEEKLDDAASLIFTSHLLILKDPDFMDEVLARIEGGESPPKALLMVSQRYIDIFTHSPNPYVREKVQDVEDLVLRVIGNMSPRNKKLVYVRGKVVIAQKLFPSDILRLSSEKVAGIIQVTGGTTSHISFLARSLRIPLVIVDMPELMNLPPGTDVAMDGEHGSVYIDPLPDVIQTIKEARRQDRKLAVRQDPARPETLMADGTRVTLLANINLFSDLKLAMKLNAEGVGLYRTEFPFLIRSDFPTEAEQFVIYRRIVDYLAGKEIIFRTLDIGGDKIISYYQNYQEANPVLGMRSIRFSLKNIEGFKQQIRAILRTCPFGRVKIMFPMISSLDEFLKARSVLYQCLNELREEGMSFDQKPQVGMMIEVPSLVEIMDELADVADFFSIGTNDFVQYMLGVDRANEKVADYYLPHHPAVLRSLKRIVEVAVRRNKEIAVCGEMAHQSCYIPFFLGIGIRIFSMDAVYIPQIQKQIESISLREAKDLTGQILDKGAIADLSDFFEVMR
jgi:phosphotransferase system enzyme I (PtsP)